MTDVRGSVYARRQRDGSTVWRARAWIDGARQSLGSYPTRAEAEEALRVAQEDHAEAGGALTLGAWGERWLHLRETDGKHRAAANDRSRWQRHVAGSRLAGLELRRIARGDVVRWLDGMWRATAVSTIVRGGAAVHRPTERRLSRQTVVHALRLVQRALRDAIERGLIPTHPALRIEIPRDASAEEPWTWLTAEEIERVLGLPGLPPGRSRPSPQAPALHPEQRSAITVAIYTGLRAGELWGLRWRDVVLRGDRPEIVVGRSYEGPTKSGKVRRVPLLEPARRALETWSAVRPGIGDALVWPAEDRGPHAEGYDCGWPRVLRYARVRADVRFHDLRHTCASHLVQGTWTARPLSMLEVRDWLGHASIVVTQRYSHLAPGGLHDAVRRGPQVDRTPPADHRIPQRTQKDSNLRPSAPEAEGGERVARGIVAIPAPGVHPGSTRRNP